MSPSCLHARPSGNACPPASCRSAVGADATRARRGRAVPTGYNDHVVARTVLRIYGSEAEHVGVLDQT
jgi:hypothetical protein